MRRIVLCLSMIGLLAWLGLFQRQLPIVWSDDELARIASLTLPPSDQLQQQVVRTGNRYWNDPRAQTLGQALFFDTRLSGSGKVSCASCHQPQHGFADPVVLSTGMATTKRHSPSLLGVALQPWQFWDGRADSLWSQALGPLEDPAEHGANRLQLAHLISQAYAQRYTDIFGPLPSLDGLGANASPVSDNLEWQYNWQRLSITQQTQINRVFTNIGKSLAAFQSRILPSDTRFDRFARELVQQGESALLSRVEQYGLKLFINDQRAQCMRCHNGPLLSNGDFQVTGIKDTSNVLGRGREEGIIKALNSPFNCRSIYSDALPESDCAELDFAKRSGAELSFAFKVPSLRNVARTAPYMHNGSLATLADVLHFYTRAQSQYTLDEGRVTARGAKQEGHLDIEPLPLASAQLAQIEAFLRTLNSE